ncbi:hypothetical protein C8D87_10618 [Lentzea atacamensis]|uniref:Uncharacterized protein n=1 Tax=Lentzea atacamensis TaxID=531938 RepID=A0ABX9E6C9_9PSEU|nr:hypothetical protein C8D87_10618 [Lentzea atacamensis]
MRADGPGTRSRGGVVRHTRTIGGAARRGRIRQFLRRGHPTPRRFRLPHCRMTPTESVRSGRVWSGHPGLPSGFPAPRPRRESPAARGCQNVAVLRDRDRWSSSAPWFRPSFRFKPVVTGPRHVVCRHAPITPMKMNRNAVATEPITMHSAPSSGAPLAPPRRRRRTAPSDPRKTPPVGPAERDAGAGGGQLRGGGPRGAVVRRPPRGHARRAARTPRRTVDHGPRPRRGGRDAELCRGQPGG